MIDDLTTRGCLEPYGCSRREPSIALLLRIDNADLRLHAVWASGWLGRR